MLFLPDQPPRNSLLPAMPKTGSWVRSGYCICFCFFLMLCTMVGFGAPETLLAAGAVPKAPEHPVKILPAPSHDSTPFVVAVPPYPPYTEARDGSPEGFAVDIVKMAAYKADMRVILRKVPQSDVLRLLQNGEIDAAFPLYRTPLRAARGTFCDTPVTTSETVAIFTHDMPPWQFDGTIESLAHVRMGIVNGHSYGPMLDRALEQGLIHSLTIFSDFTECYMALLADGIDIMPMDTLMAKELARRHGTSGRLVNLMWIEQVVPLILFGPGKKQTELAARFCNGLTTVWKDGTSRRIRGLFIGTYYGE
ncbi:substrate-binding periplasmic protein [Oleidesulfovibrio sp.]|uniref:substrate-binding periplasmic protein n=1 Tax=Oleidesulfovibrio sp. TaxID=2909707 RepID=UPI003A8B09D4